ncbi:MAG: hypothetical protein HY515_01770 [Candidatus Aenigmarchaeota archaeon]|nr:hypothetical protein [Candidatus Aenigmarchaeota archaeon]
MKTCPGINLAALLILVAPLVLFGIILGIYEELLKPLFRRFAPFAVTKNDFHSNITEATMGPDGEEKSLIPYGDESLIHALSKNTELEPVLNLAIKIRQQKVAEGILFTLLEDLTGIRFTTKNVHVVCPYCGETIKVEVKPREQKPILVECSKKSFFGNIRKLKVSFDGNGNIHVEKSIDSE